MMGGVALLNFIRPFLAMAMIEQAHHCSSGLTKTFFDLVEEYRGRGDAPQPSCGEQDLRAGMDGQTAG